MRNLILLAAFVCVLSVVAVSPAKAVKPLETQTLYSAPLNGSSDLACMALNVSERVVPIKLELFSLDGISQAEIGPTDTDPGVGVVLPRTLAGTNYCKVVWEGEPEDIRASFCWGSGCLNIW